MRRYKNAVCGIRVTLHFEKLLDRIDLSVPQRRHRLMVGRGKHKGEIASAQYSGPEDLAPYFDPLCRERNLGFTMQVQQLGV